MPSSQPPTPEAPPLAELLAYCAKQERDFRSLESANGQPSSLAATYGAIRARLASLSTCPSCGLTSDAATCPRCAVANFLAKWVEVEPRINGLFSLQFVRSGVQYSGPTLAPELAALRAVVAKEPS
jgi:hypothetical protein